MLATQRGELLATGNFQKYAFGNEEHYVKGFMYIPGFRAGKESVEQIHLALETEGRVPFDRICGAYTYCVKIPRVKTANAICGGDVVNDTTHMVSCGGGADFEILFFAPNSEMHCLYYGDGAASDSFLELCRDRERRGLPRTFSPESVCEYYSLGKVFFGKTFLREISILPNDRYLRIRDGKMEVESKNVQGIDGESHIGSPKKYFDDLAYAVGGMKVCSALTGGYDSRMVVSMLRKKVPLKIFYSTNNEEETECRISKKIAGIINAPISVYHTEKPALTEQLLRDIVASGDGMRPLSLEGDIRIGNFYNSLKNEGFDLFLTGDGGVLHKDWEWMQDLPFYRRRSTNLRRFYHQRIAYELRSALLGPRLRPVFDNQEARFVESMLPYKKGINTESYDSLYYYVSSSQRIGYNCHSSSLAGYAPLWELDLVRNSYHLPRRERFFYNFMRKMTTEAEPEVARIPTNYGTTASSEAAYLFRDVFFQLKDYVKKAFRMLGRKFFHKTLRLRKELITWSLEDELRALPLTEEMVSWATSNGILAVGADKSKIPYAQLTRLDHLYLLKKEFDIAFGDESHR